MKIHAHSTPEPPQDVPKPTAPPVEDERGPQAPVKEPGPAHEPERLAGGAPARVSAG